MVSRFRIYRSHYHGYICSVPSHLDFPWQETCRRWIHLQYWKHREDQSPHNSTKRIRTTCCTTILNCGSCSTSGETIYFLDSIMCCCFMYIFWSNSTFSDPNLNPFVVISEWKWKVMGHARWLLQYLTSGVRQSRFYPLFFVLCTYVKYLMWFTCRDTRCAYCVRIISLEE